MSYDGLHTTAPAEAPHLGGNVTIGDPFTFCPEAWNYLIDRFCLQSVLDLGCGCGNASHYFFRKGMRVVAVDGLVENVDRSLYPATLHDLATGPVRTVVDLVHCQEVVEHIDEVHLDHLLASLMCGRYIVMTHALPGQIGHHHVNLQPSSYWIDHLAARGCSFLVEDTRRVRALAQKESANYLAHTGLVFCNNNRI